MGFVGILAAKSRGIRENYRESTYIGLSVACCAPLWLGWALAGLALSPKHQVRVPDCVTRISLTLTCLGRMRGVRAVGHESRGVLPDVPATRTTARSHGT